ncbi:hypothetical protein J7J83_01305 [bacterium]|nr:hypothetical protein [bacterium]
MKHLNNLFSRTFLVISLLAIVGCNDHLGGDAGNNDIKSGTISVDTLSSSRTALWVEMGDGDFDFALSRERTDSDPDLIGHKATLPSGLSAMIVTGEDQLLIESDDLVEVWEVPTEKIGAFEMLIRNLWMLPAGWQPNLFPRTEGEAADLEILLSAFICGQELDLYSRGCQGNIPSDLFHFVGETAYYEWSNHGHAKYVFVVVRGETSF